MRMIPIHRQKFPPPGPPMPPLADDFTHYPYPYHDFPTIVSHVHPRFIICNSGSKLDSAKEIYKWLKKYEIGTRDDLAKVQDIWNAWKKTAPTGEFDMDSPKGGDSDVSDNNSEKTRPHRVLRSMRLKRKVAGEQASPTPKSSKQRGLQDGGVWLDDETLHEFTRQTSSNGGLAIPKDQLILDWMKGFSDSKSMVENQEELKNDRGSDDTMADHKDAAVIGGEAWVYIV